MASRTLFAMQTLGLQDETKRSDGFLKSIFWPSVQNAWDVDYLGQQGFWICTLIAILTLAISVLSSGGNLWVTSLGILGAVIYFTGGMGVREKSWAAAGAIFFAYFLETMLGLGNGAISPVAILRILILGVLFSNMRATLIASRWRQPTEDEDRPTRFNETFRDKLVDQWPPMLWPMVRIPFYLLVGLWCLICIFGMVMLALIRLGVVPIPPASL